VGHIQDRWYKKVIDPVTKKPVRVKTKVHGQGMRYKVRYLDPDGQERSKTFPDKAKKQAEDFLVGVESDKREGRYVNPGAGRVTFKEFAEKWLAAQTFDWTTRERVESRIRTHFLPYFGKKSVGAIRPSDVLGWLRWLQARGVAPNSRALYFNHLVPIFNLAIDDKRITNNPALAKSVQRPREQRAEVVPWPRERAAAVRRALPDRYKPAVSVPAGIGLRQGEVFGFSLDDVDRTRNMVNVVRQVRIVNNALVFSLPKRGKTREVPIGAGLLAELDDYAQTFPVMPVTLPWEHPDGKQVTVNLLMVTDEGTACRRQTFNMMVWQPALKKAGIEKPTRADGMHALRHLYASVLLDAGESIKALSGYLGHTDPGFTLKVYTHLLPSSYDRTRKAVDGLFTAEEENEQGRHQDSDDDH
jgi:integrase